MRFRFVSLLSIFFLPGFAGIEHSFSDTIQEMRNEQSRLIAIEGKWRGEFEIRPGLKVPFVFEFAKGRNNNPYIYFLNGDERFEGGSVKQVNDSVIVSLDQFDNEFALKLAGDVLSGELRKQNSSTPGTPLTAKKNLNYRFKEISGAAAANVSGTYDITFKATNGSEEKAVGLFTQEGNKLKGTFLRITGDSRYLEGTI
ncbi:MAG: hypothetical protein EOO04_38200, partial [Chitinophagaceae bacterium]